MNMNATWIPMAAALLLGGIAACDHRVPDAAAYRASCLTHEDVLRHRERSRNGLSATCDEAVRVRSAGR